MTMRAARASYPVHDEDYGDDEPPRRRKARPVKPAGGLPWQMLSAARANPMMTASVVAGLVATSLIVSNALTNQSGRHPAPLFETRTVMGPISVNAVPVPVAEPPPRPVRTTEISPPPPPASAPATPAEIARQILNPPEAPAAEAPAAPVEDPRVRTLQALLKERGLYTGTVDGLTGPMTAEAIRAFERQMNLATTGEVSDRLIGLAQRNRVAAQTAPRPPVQAPAQPRVGGVPVQNAAFTPANEPRTVASIPATPRPQPAPARPAAAPPTDLRTAPSAEERTARVQRALAAIGLNPGRADGRMRPETQEAIKRFEIDRGLKVSGQVSDRLMFELIAAGAMR